MDDQHPVARSVPRFTPRPSSSPGARCSVLLAEDNPINQMVAVRLLVRRGFHVDVATDGLEAVRMHGCGDYDLIFMDCQMPGLDGFEATARIRESEPEGRRAPIIALTANTSPLDRERCLAVGMDDHVAKPVRTAELDAAIARALATR